MPVLKSAIKKQRVDKRRVEVNIPIRARVKTTIKEARTHITPESIKKFYQAVDHAVAKKLVAKRTAARMKSRLLKLARTKLTESPFGGKTEKKTAEAKPKTVKKAPAKKAAAKK